MRAAELLDAEATATLAAIGVDDPATADLEVVGYPSGSPATAALYRVRGPRGSLFCKVLQHLRHWPTLALVPPEVAEALLRQIPWRAELDLWEPWLLATLPEGLRAPTLHALVELPDDRAAVWMEDVAESPEPWDLARYERAAGLLGRWNARSTDPDLVARCPSTAADAALRIYVDNAVRPRLGVLGDDELWSHPWLAEHGDLRSDLRELAAGIDAMLDRLDAGVQGVPHGDASPQNLLVPAGAPDTFVVIDLSFRTPHALGFDLGQLLVGLTEAGLLPASRVPEVAATVLPAYSRGLDAEGATGLHEQAADAFATSALLRSGFDGIPYDVLGTEAHRTTFDERVALTRHLVALYRSTR